MPDLMDEDPGMDAGTADEDVAPADEDVAPAAGAEPALADLAGRYGIDSARGAYDKLTQSTEKAREALQSARERILARQYDRSHALLALAAGLGSPTRSGAFGETMGNVAQALQGPLKEKRQFEIQREQDVIGIDQAMLGLDQKSADAALKLAELEARMMPKPTREKWTRVVLPNGELILTSDAGNVKRTNIKGPKPVGLKLTKGEEALDRKYVDDYIEWISGGAADSMKSQTELQAAQLQLTSDDDLLSGPWVGLIPKGARDFILPESAAVQEDIEATVQRSLRPILGAQFTDPEGERLIKRVYNPRFKEAQNARRLFRLIRQIELAYQNKQRAAEYFEEHGTLKGFKGKIHYTVADFDPDLADQLEAAEKAAAAKAGATNAAAPDTPQQPAAVDGGGIKEITSDAEFDALPEGALFYGPGDSVPRKKPITNQGAM